MAIFEKLEAQNNFSTTEKEIATYIINNCEKVIYSTVREIADATFTSSSAVMRTVRKVFDGNFNDFKVDLAFELQSLSSDNDGYLAIEKQDTVYTVMNKVARLQTKVITETQASLDFDQLRRVVEMLEKVDGVYIYAEEIDIQTAKEFRYMLARLGKAIEVVDEDGYTMMNSILKQKNQLAIFISHRYLNFTLTKKMAMCYRSRIPVIFFSGYDNPELEKYCNELIRTKHGIPYSELAPIVYTTSIKYVLNVIICCIVAVDYDNCRNTLKGYTKLLRHEY